MWGRTSSGKELQRLVLMNDDDDDEHFQQRLKRYSSNRVRTAKYNLITFLPLFLFEMFSRAAYFYFLCQAGLSWWDVVSPLGGFGSTFAIVFVLGVSGVKAAAEDLKRHSEDTKTNMSGARVLTKDGSVREVQWQDVHVGDIVVVKDDELIPADLLCLKVEMPDGVCYVKTTNLDGESNLKIRRPMQVRELSGEGTSGLRDLKAALECDPPNADLHKFKGCFSYRPLEGSSNAEPMNLPVTMNEVLLRGCMLKNSGAVYGLVIYTGDETRIQRNAAKVPFKVGAYDTFLNPQISLLMILQIGLCFLGAVLATEWRESEGKSRYYLAADEPAQGNFGPPLVFGLVTLLTYWIILSYMVPISLFVTMELVKFWQGFMFINHDPYMVCGETMEGARCRNSNLMEDLGKIEYIFSDKTGTLTSNEMRLRQVAIKGIVYGSKDTRLEELPPCSWQECMAAFDGTMLEPMKWLQMQQVYAGIVKKGGSSRDVLKASGSRESVNSLSGSLQNSLESEGPGSWLTNARDNTKGPPADSKRNALPPLGSQAPLQPLATAAIHKLEAEILTRKEDGIRGLHIVDLWLNICICHSLLVEKGPDGNNIYQGPSPDEIALVEAGKQLGFEFQRRDANSVYLDFQGMQLRFELLNVIEFSSDRKRMSVVARCPDGTIRLFCKGADVAVLERLSKDQEQQYMETTNENLSFFARSGLRTLAHGTKVIPPNEYKQWDRRFQEASNLSDGREEQMATLQDEVERDLELVGISAIEDKLQDGVPQAIATFLEAGIKVWMITGDKQETAINIATSCRLLVNPGSALICSSDSYLGCKNKLSELLEDADPNTRAAAVPQSAGDLQPLLGGPHASDSRRELVIDGRTLTHIIGTDLEPVLARLGSHCASVVVCRASPSQKASIVRVMREYEFKLATEGSSRLMAWKRRFDKRVKSKMLSIGDGANDVAMIQAADIGIGVMGKEGRQAVNNSDFAIAQFKHLVRLLLVHGQISDYRLANLIIYSFYKNMCFAAVLFAFQFFCAYTGQTLVDDIAAALFNVVFTSVPILFFSVMDRKVSNTTLVTFPQTYNKSDLIGLLSFWRRGVLHGVLDGAASFAVPYLSLNVTDIAGTAGLFCLGKTCFFALLGAVTLEMIAMTKYWTPFLAVVIFLSYFLAYAFIYVLPWALMLFDVYDPAQVGVADALLSSPSFYLAVLGANASTLGFRLFVLWVRAAVKPSDMEVLSAREQRPNPWDDVPAKTRERLAGLGVRLPDRRCPSAGGSAAGARPPPPASLSWQATPEAQGAAP